jgi:hypothetical protein
MFGWVVGMNPTSIGGAGGTSPKDVDAGWRRLTLAVCPGVRQVDNVGSKQMQQIRFALRGHAEVLMGKNTRIRKVRRQGT